MLPRIPILAPLLLALPAAAQANLYTFGEGGAPGDELGHALAGDVDLDGDFHDDVVIGIPGNGAGAVLVRSGRTGAVLLHATGTQAGERFGHAVAWIDDVNGDSVKDLVVGAPEFDFQGFPGCGRVVVISGANGQTIGGMSLLEVGARTGYAVSALPDINGDGVGDYAVGAPFVDGVATNSGWVGFRSGTDSLHIESLVGQSGEQLGSSLALYLDGSGVPSLLIGAPTYSGLAPFGGRVVSYDLSFALPLQQVHAGAVPGGLLGLSVANAGDVNGDGVHDVLLGEPLHNASGTGAGRVRVHSGKSPFPTIRVHDGVAGSQLGSAVAGVGDVDGDGRGDYLLGAPRADFLFSQDVGAAMLHSGASGQHLQTVLGTVADGRLGSSLSRAGRINGDFVPDLLLGAHESNGESGLARVVLCEAPAPTTYCTAMLNSDGCLPKIASQGAPSLSAGNTFHVTASGLKPQMPGILIWSRTQGQQPFGGGTLCLGGQVNRTPGQFSGGAVPCSGTYDFHASWSFLADAGLSAGETVNAQFWSRDTGFPPPNAIGLTNALSFTVLP